MRIGKRYGDKPPLGGPQGPTVDACKMSKEVPAAFPGEPIHLSLRTTTMSYLGTYMISGSVILEGDARDRSFHSIGEVGITLV